MQWTNIVGVALAPLAAAILFGVIGSGIRLAIARYMADGWLKRQLLAERIKSQYSQANDRIAREAALHPNGWRDCIKRNPVIINGQATTLPPEAKK